MASHPWRNGMRAALLTLLMAALWVTFAPAQAGGQVTYIIVAGASMNPALRRGDLVIARQAEDYQVGDIVAYRHPMIGPVIHRILAAQKGAFTLKGDANAWVDSYQPMPADMLGKAWVRLPGVGRMLTWLRQPLALAVVALLISLLVVTSVAPMSAPEKKPGRGNPARRSGLDSAAGGGILQSVVFVLGTVGLLSAILAIAAWTHPVSRETGQSAPYEHRGAFTYTAAVPRQVYGEDRLESGDPVYLRLTRFVDFRFDYHFAAEQPHAIQGITRLVAQVSDVNGWQRTIVLQDARPFAGDGTSLVGKLDLNVISSYLQNLEDQTGVSRPFYTLAILPEIHMQGDLAGNVLEDSFAPQLKFMIDKLQLQVLPPDPDEPDADPLRPRAEDAVETVSVLPNRLSLLGASLSVSTARRVALLGLVIGLGGLALLGLWFYREQKTDPAAMIQLKFGAQMAEVRAGSFEAELGSQEVVSIDDLARIAEKSGQMIYWIASEAGRDYFVQDGRLLYHYWMPLTSKSESGGQRFSHGTGESGKEAG